MEAALLPAEKAGFQFQFDGLDDEWETVEEPETAPLDDQMGPWAHKQYLDKYSWKDEDGEPTEVWPDTAYRVVRNVLGALGYTDHDSEFQDLVRFVTERKFMPGGRYLAMAGRQYHPISNCFLYKCEDSREGWADLVRKCILSLSSGGGVGVVYSDVRANGTYIKKTGGLATGPLSPACMVNEVARHVMQGGQRRAAIWAGLHWDHADIFDWIDAKNWSPEVKEAKKIASERGDEAPAQLDMTNISVILDDEFFVAFGDTNHDQHDWAQKVYWETVRNMVATGEPGFSINTGDDVNESLRNPCCEITSESDSDICCLGSINLARVESKKEFAELVNLGSLFLLAGTVYGDTPHDEVRVTREQNRRLGLGIMGVHEWLLVRGHRYEMVDELRDWLGYYEQSTRMAHKWAEVHNLSKPIKTRAIAPTGCQRPDTLLTTDQGFLELGELGDENGSQWQPLKVGLYQEKCPVVQSGRFYVNGIATTKKVGFRSGNEVESTPNHRYRVLRDKDYLWCQAGDLEIGDDVVVPLDTYQKNDDPDLVDVGIWHYNERSVTLPSRIDTELAWFLGVFNADGSIHTKGIRIACNVHSEDYKRIVEVGKSLFNIDATFEDNGRGCLSVHFSSSRLLRWLYVNALDKRYSNEAEIPFLIRTSSRASIQSYLDGFWYGDGSESSAKYIDTSSSRLTRQLITIHRGLGTNVSVYKNQSGFAHTDGTYTQMNRITQIKTRSKIHTNDVDNRLHGVGLEKCTIDRVASIKDSQSQTLDIEVPDTHSYIANGVVSHNTIGLIAETTTSAEPIFCAAYKRRFLDTDGKWRYQFVADPTAHRLITEHGVDPDAVEDAYMLAYNVERRIKFQAEMQEYIDQAISSTINLPYPIVDELEVRDFGDTLIRYLPRLRGITVYPDGARSGQPLEAVPYTSVIGKEGLTFDDDRASQCTSGSCGV